MATDSHDIFRQDAAPNKFVAPFAIADLDRLKAGATAIKFALRSEFHLGETLPLASLAVAGSNTSSAPTTSSAVRGDRIDIDQVRRTIEGLHDAA